MSGSVTVDGGSAGSVTVPSTTTNNQLFLQLAISQLGTASITGATVGGGGTAPTVPTGTIGVALVSGGGAVTIPTGYGIVALSGGAPATVSGGDSSTQILSGTGGLTYSGGAASVIATGGNNVITATVGGTYPGQFVDVNGNSTVTGDNALIMTEGGASSINAGSGNFVVSSGTDTVTTGSGPNTVAAIGSVGGVTHAGDGDLLFLTGGTLGSAGVQTVFGGLGNETVFAGPKSIYWQGSNPGGSLTFIGGPSASTVIGGSGQETLFGGTGGGVFSLGSHAGNIFVGDTASYSIDAGAGSSVIYGNSGSNITFTGATTETGNLLVVGSGAETINAAASFGNQFIISAGDATLTGSNAGSDSFFFFNQGTATADHTITITNFSESGIFQNLVFVGYGFNTSNVQDGTAISGPSQTVVEGSDHITLSDHTTIILQGFSGTVSFTNYNALS